MEEDLLDEQLRRRLEILESPERAAHLAGDLPLRDVLVTILGLTLAIIAFVWWAY